MTGTSHTYRAQQDDDLCAARSLIALLRHVASLGGDMGDDARHGLYLVAQQAEGILIVCIERARVLRDEALKEGLGEMQE